MLNKIKDTTKADDDEITRNLLGLAKTRPDIFGERCCCCCCCCRGCLAAARYFYNVPQLVP
jgi:hypothetical protein